MKLAPLEHVAHRPLWVLANFCILNVTFADVTDFLASAEPSLNDEGLAADFNQALQFLSACQAAIELPPNGMCQSQGAWRSCWDFAEDKNRCQDSWKHIRG
eukprot:1146010-Pelagomonas_calceolata.AAC.2